MEVQSQEMLIPNQGFSDNSRKKWVKQLDDGIGRAFV